MEHKYSFLIGKRACLAHMYINYEGASSVFHINNGRLIRGCASFVSWRAESNRNSKASKLARALARAMFKVKLFHLSGLRLKRNTEKAESHAIIATIELATFPWVFLFSAIRHRGMA
ncbi:hypothetical protein T05_6052 [Trichinella murrelli]|uniref:Uncharacterized protein n=1 Tax=Trichinella murrelli TaxID=144512 RepID=A0A0V0U9S5_9BILA|nr:hypothetical protein T05_6052 [Trichinella murrelli]